MNTVQSSFDLNHSKFIPEDPSGFYESYFQRANHPTRPLAFWIRYTITRQQGNGDEASCELWAIYFDGEENCITAVKEAIPVEESYFSQKKMDVRIKDATLTDGFLQGIAISQSHNVQWVLNYTGNEAPLLLLPEYSYDRKFPKAKALVGTPNAIYSGSLMVDGREIAINGWKGSQNHNWGSQHTDRYAWGQVAGFDNAPDVFLECCTAQVKLGPVWSPRLTFVVLRDQGQEIAINGLLQSIRASGNFDFFNWNFDTRGAHSRIRGHIHAPAASFVGLSYKNPPGGTKTCLNTKLANAEIVIERSGLPTKVLKTTHRAAFEILTDRKNHGIPILA